MLPGSYPHRKYMICIVWNIIQCGTDKQLNCKPKNLPLFVGWHNVCNIFNNNKTRVYIIKCEIICHSCCMMIIEHANLLGLVHFLKSDFDIDWLRSVTAWIFHIPPPPPRTVEPAVTQHSLPPRRWRLERSFCQPLMISDRPIAPTRWSHLGRCKHKQMPSQL